MKKLKWLANSLVYLMAFSAIDLQAIWKEPVDIANSSTGFIVTNTVVNSSNKALVASSFGTGVSQDSPNIPHANFFNGKRWSGPVALTESPNDSTSPLVALNNRTFGIAVWNDNVNLNINSAVFTGKYWKNPVAIGVGQNPALALNCRDQAVAAWVVNSDTSAIIEVANFNGQTWSSPVILTPTVAGQYATPPAVGIDKQGNALAVWVLNDSNLNISSVMASTFSGTVWSAPVTLSTAISYSNVALGLNASGFGLIAFNNNGTLIQTIAYNNGTFGPVTTVATDVALGEPTIALNNKNQALIAYINYTQTTYVSNFFDGSTYGPTQQINVIGTFVPVQLNPSIAIDGEGIGLAAFFQGLGDGSGLNTAIEVSTFNGTTWSFPYQLGNGSSLNPSVAMNEAGFSVLSWNELEGVSEILVTTDFITSPIRSKAGARRHSVVADGESTLKIKVKLVDSKNEPVEGNRVYLTSTSASSLVSAPVYVTDKNGEVSFKVSNTVLETVTYQIVDAENNITLNDTVTVVFK